MTGSKREVRRLEAAEEVCKAFRKSLAHHTEQNKYQNLALDWLLDWMKYAPEKIKFGEPKPRKDHQVIS